MPILTFRWGLHNPGTKRGISLQEVSLVFPNQKKVKCAIAASYPVMGALGPWTSGAVFLFFPFGQPRFFFCTVGSQVYSMV